MLKFGTDGVRGVANAELTPELALALGRAAARVLEGDHFAVGRDTRRSGPLLEAALSAGLASEGADVTLLGVAPTPEVAWWSVQEDPPGADRGGRGPHRPRGRRPRRLRRSRRRHAGGAPARRPAGRGRLRQRIG